MCTIGYHNCPACQEETKCYQPDYECDNWLPTLCEKCEYWQEELEKDEQRKHEQMMWERERWESEYGGKS